MDSGQHRRRALLAGTAVAALVLSQTALAFDFIVTNNADSGTGSLRQAIIDANVSFGSHNILFSIDNQTITLASDLPALQNNITIDGGTNNTVAGSNFGLSVSAGTTVLQSLSNTYSGPTNLNAGTLRANWVNIFSANSDHVVASGATLDLNSFNQTIRSLSGNGNVALGSGTLTLGGNSLTPLYFYGAISGTGGVSLQGSQEFRLYGINDYSGATTISSGAFRVIGALTQSDITVDAAGTLTGGGSVRNVVMNGGQIIPGLGFVGSSLTVNGNLVMNGGTYRASISPTAVSSAIVNGTATLGGAALQLSFNPGNYTTRKVSILSTTGGVTGGFSSISSNAPAGLRVNVFTEGNDVFLSMLAALAVDIGSLSTNQQNVAHALNTYFNNGGALPPAFVTLFGLSGDALKNALTQASGEPGASMSSSTFMAWQQFFNLVFDPFAGNRSGYGGGARAFAPTDADVQSEAVRLAYAAVAPKEAPAMATKAALHGPAESRWSVWGGGYGGSAKTEGNAQIGSHDTTSRAYGFALGADHKLTPDTLIGFALGGGGTSFGLDQGLGGGTSDMFQASVYARQNWGAAYLMGAFGYGWQDFTLTRTVNIAGTDKLQADFDAHTLAGRAEGGWRFGSPFGGMTPYAAVQVVSLDLPDYTERAVSGADDFALSYAGRIHTQTRSELGTRLDYAMPLPDALLTLRGRAAWAHAFGDDRIANVGFLALPGTAFTVNGAQPDADSLLVSAGAELSFRNGISLTGSFEGEFSGNTRSYAGKGAVRYRW